MARTQSCEAAFSSVAKVEILSWSFSGTASIQAKHWLQHAPSPQKPGHFQLWWMLSCSCRLRCSRQRTAGIVHAALHLDHGLVHHSHRLPTCKLYFVNWMFTRAQQHPTYLSGAQVLQHLVQRRDAPGSLSEAATTWSLEQSSKSSKRGKMLSLWGEEFVST